MSPQDIQRRIAEASVMHNAPFAQLPTPVNELALDTQFFQKWVIPFYMETPRSEEYRIAFREVRTELTDGVIGKLFGDFNWRSRSVGALFAALRNRSDFVETIGNLMLKSEVCYAGRSYSMALACFGNPLCVDYLERYLTHYLARKDLWFDQADVFSALIFLDRKAGTARHQNFVEPWNDFVANKPDWDIESSLVRFERDMSAIVALAK
jgi:hypothetical protein